MKIKEGCEAFSGDFWYDLSVGGYLVPEEILEDPTDVKKVKEAIDVIKEFEDACIEQIEGFQQ